MLEPNTAIRCQDETELYVTLKMLEKADIGWIDDTKATEADWLYSKNCGLIIYICPPDQYRPKMHLEWDRIHNAVDGGNRRGWTYVEASDIFHNQLIAERRKRNVT